MSNDLFTVRARSYLTHARVLALLTLIGMPFTLRNGVAPLLYLATAIPVGVLLLIGTLQSWRTRNQFWFWPGYVVLVAGNIYSLNWWAPKFVPYFFQWFGLVTLIFCGFIAAFHSRVIRLCRLDEPENA